jgi:hypothetical protein
MTEKENKKCSLPSDETTNENKRKKLEKYKIKQFTITDENENRDRWSTSYYKEKKN